MTIKSMVIDHNFNFLIFQFFYALKKWRKKMMLHLPNLLPPITKLQKNDFGKIKKNLPHQGSNPHQLRNNPNFTPFITDPSTKASPPRCLHENSRQKIFIDKHLRYL